MKRIAIIGGGVTGLTAAFTLLHKGVEVSVFEAGEVLGGAIRTYHESGYITEAGPNTILETSPVITELIRSLGIEDKKLYANDVSSKRYIVKDGKPQQLPMNPKEFITSSFFSLDAKLKLLKEPFKARIISDDESLADFTRRRLGNEFLDYAVNPFVAGVNAGDPERLSVRHAFEKLYRLEEKYGSLIKGQLQGAKERKRSAHEAKHKAKMFSFDDGLQVLIDALAAKLESRIHYLSIVAKIERRVEPSSNIDITFTSGKRIDGFDAVLLTAPAHRIADIEFVSYPSTPSSNALPLYGLRDIYYPPVTSLALGFDKHDVRHALDGFGMLIPKVEGFRILGTLFSSTLFSNRVPKDHVLLTTYIGGARQPELATLNDDALLKVVLADLRVLLGVHAKPSYIHRTTWQKAIPQYEVGYDEYIEILTNFENDNPGIYLAGNYRGGISVGDCIVNGKNIAEKVFL